MSTVYDEESMLADIKAILVANLNTKIAAVEAEKVSLGFPATNLASVDTSTGYLQQSLSSFPFDVSPAIFFGIEATPPEHSPGPVTVRKIKVFVEILVVDTQADALMPVRINRYARAIREVIQENWDKLGIPIRMFVDSITPLSFQRDANTSEEVWVGGATINAVIA